MTQRTLNIDGRSTVSSGRLAQCFGTCAVQVVLGFALASGIAAGAADKDQAPAASQPQRHAHHAVATPNLESRVETLSKALGLDADQQRELRRILEDQREQVRKVWSDPSVPSAYRVSATQAIGDRAGDAIRALLNEGQKEKYNQPRQAHAAETESDKRSVDEWMKVTSPKEAEAGSIR